MVEAIYKLLSEDGGLADALASYNHAPAVFYQSVPSDTEPGWASGPQYPRVVFSVEMQDDPERHASGRLLVEIVCTHETREPEDIEHIVRPLLDGTFFTDADKTTYAVMWDRSDLFDEREPGKSESASDLLGIVAAFDVVELPVQITTDPDPVQSMNVWSKKALNNALIVGHDALPHVWRPQREQFAVYWRLASLGPAARPDSWNVSWHDAQLVGHIVADRHELMQSIAKVLIDDIQQRGEIIMADSSPMFVNRITYAASANPIKQGQITVSGMYGVLRRPEYAPWLTPHTNYQTKGGKS